MGHVLGAEKEFFLIRGRGRPMPSGRREGMFPGRYSELFGLGERLGCILNLGHSFDAIEAYLGVLVGTYEGRYVAGHLKTLAYHTYCN